MSSGRCCWSLGSLLLLLGRNLGILTDVPQDLVNGTVGQSVLLPVPYRLGIDTPFPVPIEWRFSNFQDQLTSCTVQSCSLGAGGAPSQCSAGCFTHPTYRGRAEVFPENGSLLLWDLQPSDSGVYTVTLGTPGRTWNITLTVHEQRLTPEHTDDSDNNVINYIYYCVPGVCLIIVLLILLCCYKQCWGAAQQKKRTIKEQQGPREELPMESHAAGELVTVYATVGEGLGQPQPRPALEAMYASVTSPHLPRRDTGIYHLLD
ncbi:uncharacterized protein LJ264_008392 isoform 1-T1 [Porphyrio hochstetteri]